MKATIAIKAGISVHLNYATALKIMRTGYIKEVRYIDNYGVVRRLILRLDGTIMDASY